MCPPAPYHADAVFRREFVAVPESETGPWLTPSSRPGTGQLIEVHRLRALQAIDVVGAPAYDPKATSADMTNCFSAPRVIPLGGAIMTALRGLMLVTSKNGIAPSRLAVARSAAGAESAAKAGSLRRRTTGKKAQQKQI
jgi:hypothetical protein